jgi:hypothetical protein
MNSTIPQFRWLKYACGETVLQIRHQYRNHLNKVAFTAWRDIPTVREWEEEEEKKEEEKPKKLLKKDVPPELQEFVDFYKVEKRKKVV